MVTVAFLQTLTQDAFAVRHSPADHCLNFAFRELTAGTQMIRQTAPRDVLVDEVTKPLLSRPRSFVSRKGASREACILKPNTF